MSTVYVAFDADEDMHWYRMLTAWNKNPSMNFTFKDAHDLNVARDGSLVDSIKVQLRARMQESDVMLLLVGEKTRGIRGYIPWEVSYGRHIDLPIVVSNLNDVREYDPTRCPSSIESGKGAVHVSFEAAIIRHAVQFWPTFWRTNPTTAPYDSYFYKSGVYKDLGL